MIGLTEDLLNAVARNIELNWERMGGNISYFVEKVKETPLTPKDLDRYIDKHTEECHEGVNRVFAAIVYEDLLQDKKGGER